jgi:hypothetical protein
VQTAAMAWLSAMVLRGLKLFLCAERYLPTAFAMSLRHDPLPRMSAVFANSETNVAYLTPAESSWPG